MFKKFNEAINQLKEKLQSGYNENSEHVSFQTMWDSFPLNKEVNFEGKLVSCIQQGEREVEGIIKRYTILKGKMPVGSEWYKNHHNDAREIFIPLKGQVVELVTTLQLDAYSKPLIIRPEVPHSFKALTDFEFIAKIYEL